MILLLNLILLVLILRLSFEKRLLKSFLYRGWPDVISVQHLVFWGAFIVANLYLYLNWFDIKVGLTRFSFMLIANVILYQFCFRYLVPTYYETKKYQEYIRYTGIVYVLSCLLRILIEPELFRDGHVNQVAFLLLVYVSQSIIILISSMLGISKFKLIVESELAKMETLKKEADLDLMKSKINPHFLFNTLNNIYSHSYLQDRGSANFIKQLSLLLQYTTYEVGKKRIIVDREIEMITALSSLYQLKYNNQLNLVFDYSANDYFSIIEIPPTIYFSLFENAIKHSGMGVDLQAMIHTSLVLKDDKLSFSIKNSKTDKLMRLQDEHYSGAGLKILKTIMDTEYPGNYNFQVIETENEYMTILEINI